MRTVALLLLILSSSLLLGGCKSGAMAKSESQAVMAPTADSAVVVFMRPATFGYAVQSVVYDATTDENVMIGIVSSGAKVAYRAKPGEHMFMVVSEGADFLQATLDANKTYYVKVEPRMGWLRARFSLDPVRGADLTVEKIASLKTSCDLYENTEKSRNWAFDNATSVQLKREEYFKKWNAKSPKDKEEATLLASDGR